ncbi:MAG TPA: glycoside hydrolase [Candidatus Omnitrophica bacterium]|nr:MAG: glycoside hydrolase [Omnitrophica WOR_2 bacterium GWA2_45_18]HBR15588.1 glycoside hydrolase [Candidatus Omnitrophota bacterium]
MNRYICIHGHFYQPPRENPWLEAIEIQDSANPYKDWNERITAECYLPNTASRILDPQQRIIDIVNNYAKISFNFGPTLLSWMEKSAPKVYQSILEADQLSLEKFSGHGSALAQCYNHMIMPLANPRDQRTQVIWGIKDFEHRFSRKPEGMWLPETAVDLASLEILAEFNIKFTILSPYQAKRVRPIGEEEWREASHGRIDPKEPYLCRLPSGRSIVLFFYDGPLSQDVAFGNLLKDGTNFANRLLSAFPHDTTKPALVHIADDGETYGHHHKFGNMALSYLLDYMEKNNPATITIYAEYLEKFPPESEAEILENTSWSCAHGIERWRRDCGCRIGTSPGWHQAWRTPLRQAMDWLRDRLAALYEKEMSSFLQHPWAMRDDYIDVVLNRTRGNTNKFIEQHIEGQLTKEQKIRVLKLLEMQRQAMLMYTSCGWFFDDISGIEPIQTMQYAARAMQLAKELTAEDLEGEYVRQIEAAKSNIPEYENGKKIYDLFVKPAVIDLLNVGAHYALSSIFEEYPKTTHIYAYSVNSEVYDQYTVGQRKVVIGKSLIRSEITWEEQAINFAVLHLGDHNLSAGVAFDSDEKLFGNMHKEIKEAFLQSNITDVIHLINKHFGQESYSLWDLFKNEQRKIMDQILEKTLESIETHFRQIYDYYYPLMQIRKDIRAPLPKVLAMTVEFIFNRDLCKLLENDMPDVERLEKLAGEINRWSFMRDKESISLIASERIDALMQRLAKNPQDLELLRTMEACLRILKTLSLQLDLWKAQNFHFMIGKKFYRSMVEISRTGDLMAHSWVESFDKLGNYLQVKSG